MRFLVCYSEVNPCPEAATAWVSMYEVMDLAQLGIDAPTVLYVISWGFAFVLGSFLLGWGLSLAIGLIKKL